MAIDKKGDSSLETLLKGPMSLKKAFVYLELASTSVWLRKLVQSLDIDEAKKYVVAHFKDFTEFKKEVKKLPLSAVEAVLKSKGFRVDSEDDVYDFILEWARFHHPKIEKRREILTKHLVPIICFPNMSTSKLKEVRVCPEFDHEKVSKLVIEGLLSKVEISCGQDVRASKDLVELVPINCHFSGRVYKPRYAVKFTLTKEECAGLKPDKSHKSLEFRLGTKRFYLSAECCKKDEQHHFGLYLCRVKGSKTCTLDYEFAALKKSSKEFEIQLTRTNKTFDNSGWGSTNLLGISWEEFMSDDCDYFVGGILTLRAEMVLVNNTQP